MKMIFSTVAKKVVKTATHEITSGVSPAWYRLNRFSCAYKSVMV